MERRRAREEARKIWKMQRKLEEESSDDDPEFEEIPDIDDEDALDDPDETIPDEIEEDEKQEFSDE